MYNIQAFYFFFQLVNLQITHLLCLCAYTHFSTLCKHIYPLCLLKVIWLLHRLAIFLLLFISVTWWINVIIGLHKKHRNICAFSAHRKWKEYGIYGKINKYFLL